MIGRTRAGRRPAALLAALLVIVLTGLVGCTELPTSGPVDPVQSGTPSCRGCLNVDPADPRPGDDPKTIVDGFLQAMASYEPTYATARKYLTTEAADRWDPERGTMIYSGQLASTSPTSIVLDGRLVGVLGPDRIFTVRDQRLREPFVLTKQANEWRIKEPPNGLMVPKRTFDTFYDSYNIYFLGRDGTLVPDAIYLPEQSNVASALMLALLAGPSTFLRPVVTTALPSATTLSVQSVTVDGGVADVDLSDAINNLTDQQRIQMAAQVANTLKLAQGGIQAIKFLVNGEIYHVPGADPSNGTLSVNDERIRDFAAIPPRASDQIFAATDRGARMINDPAARREMVEVSGDFGERRGVEHVAASLNGRDLAVVTNGGSVLRRQPDGGEPTVLIKDAEDLLRPQYSRQGELWEVGEKGGEQHIWVHSGNRLIEAQAPSLRDVRIVAFRLSPDGTRLALIREGVGGNRELGLARINRVEGRVIIDGWRRLDTAANQGESITQFRDVGWQDESRLVVIGSAGPQTPVGVFQVAQDASTIERLGELTDSDVIEVATSSAHNHVATVTRSGEAYWLDASRWERIADGLDSLSYPG
ncbi:LpqB family beta-propeller domain-containing protein [Microlunatus speluncae]|uniref:LpqB family beta-propeller domain-containing protein n=1 Tax=Microlunatus speluncae TaxID=2594267 RepID=UPI0012665D47|nr:LpqB family beta-propeller domain-containing protein [Microlunatus speluncae]